MAFCQSARQRSGSSTLARRWAARRMARVAPWKLRPVSGSPMYTWNTLVGKIEVLNNLISKRCMHPHMYQPLKNYEACIIEFLNFKTRQKTYWDEETLNRIRGSDLLLDPTCWFWELTLVYVEVLQKCDAMSCIPCGIRNMIFIHHLIASLLQHACFTAGSNGCVCVYLTTRKKLGTLIYGISYHVNTVTAMPL